MKTKSRRLYDIMKGRDYYFVSVPSVNDLDNAPNNSDYVSGDTTFFNLSVEIQTGCIEFWDLLKEGVRLTDNQLNKLNAMSNNRNLEKYLVRYKEFLLEAKFNLIDKIIE